MGFYERMQRILLFEKIDELVKKDKRGYLLEVDVEYPKELHENHNELLFLVEIMKNGREQN